MLTKRVKNNSKEPSQTVDSGDTHGNADLEGGGSVTEVQSSRENDVQLKATELKEIYWSETAVGPSQWSRHQEYAGNQESSEVEIEGTEMNGEWKCHSKGELTQKSEIFQSWFEPHVRGGG